MTVENIEQFFVKAQEREKFDVLSRILNVQQPELAIIFGRTKRRVDELSTSTKYSWLHCRRNSR